MRAVVVAFVSVLTACGGGGGDTPQASAPQASAPTPAPAAVTAAPAPQPLAVATPATPVATASTAPSSTCTYTDLGGNSRPCDPRWPHPGVIPPNGSTQDQVDGYNAMCNTMICMQTRCPDGQVLPFYVAYNVCPAQPAKPTT